MAYALDNRPREERDFKEFYADLDENEPLPMFVQSGGTERSIVGNSQHMRAESEIKGTASFREIHSVDASSHKVPKNMVQFGYVNSKSKQSLTYSKSAISSGLVENDLLSNDKFQVLYDMDEQDLYYLSAMNQDRRARNLNEISGELLEVMITFLEIQWYHLEKCLPPKTKNKSLDSQEMIQQVTKEFLIYGSDDATGNTGEEEQCCAVCYESECDNSNAIIFCDGCDIAVHQECYGVAFIPEGSWLCRRCLITRNQKQRCLFCPSTTGAFKQCDNGFWGHVLCCLWISELYFANPIYMEPIEGLTSVPKSRWKLQCYICRQKVGACIQCCNKNCFTAYHVTCARRSELYLGMEHGVQGALNDASSLVSYCDRHCSADWVERHDVKSGVEKTRLYFATVGDISNKSKEIKLKLSRSKKENLKKNKNNFFQWKTKNDTSIAPELFATRMKDFFQSRHVKIDNASEAVYELCAYWSLKRELKKGAPLIKRLDTTPYGVLRDDELSERFESLDVLSNDVSRLLEMATLCEKRAKVCYDISKRKLKSMDLVYFPQAFIVRGLTDKLVKLDKGAVMRLGGKAADLFRDLVKRAFENRFTSVSAFMDHYDNVCVQLSVSAKTNSAVRNTLKRWKRERAVFEKACSFKAGPHYASVLEREFAIEGLDVQARRWEGQDVAAELTDVEELSKDTEGVSEKMSEKMESGKKPVTRKVSQMAGRNKVSKENLAERKLRTSTFEEKEGAVSERLTRRAAHTANQANGNRTKMLNGVKNPPKRDATMKKPKKSVKARKSVRRPETPKKVTKNATKKPAQKVEKPKRATKYSRQEKEKVDSKPQTAKKKVKSIKMKQQTPSQRNVMPLEREKRKPETILPTRFSKRLRSS